MKNTWPACRDGGEWVAAAPNLYTQMGFNHGLASLSSRLKEHGHQTLLVNLNENLPPVPTKDELWQLVREWGRVSSASRA